MHSKFTVILFVALVGGLALFNLLTPDKIMSEHENRQLKQRPDLTLESVKTGSYMKEFDEYVIDQFVARDRWVGVKTLSERALGKQSASGVYFAQDGYLIDMFDSFDEAQYEKNLGYLHRFAKYGQEQGIRVNTILAPTASLALESKLPAFAPELDQHALLEWAGDEIPGFVDVSAMLAEHGDEYIYYRTDHHWTTLGSFYAYNEWRRQTGREEHALSDFEQVILSDEFYGTTYSKARLYTISPDYITAFQPTRPQELSVEYNLGQSTSDSIYDFSYLEGKDKYAVFLSANQSVVQIKTDIQNGEKLLMIKDSYANCFTQMALLDYEEIIILDLRYFKSSVRDFIAENQFTDILLLYNIQGFANDRNLLFLER